MAILGRLIAQISIYKPPAAGETDVYQDMADIAGTLKVLAQINIRVAKLTCRRPRGEGRRVKVLSEEYSLRFPAAVAKAVRSKRTSGTVSL